MSLARYEMIQYQDGTVAAKTQSQWDRSFGKCDRRTFHKSGEIYTQRQLKAWEKNTAFSASQKGVVAGLTHLKLPGPVRR